MYEDFMQSTLHHPQLSRKILEKSLIIMIKFKMMGRWTAPVASGNEMVQDIFSLRWTFNGGHFPKKSRLIAGRVNAFVNVSRVAQFSP